MAAAKARAGSKGTGKTYFALLKYDLGERNMAGFAQKLRPALTADGTTVLQRQRVRKEFR